MPRLESIAKAGYYPTPPSVVGSVAALIRPERPTTRRITRLLDPCCGTGAALRQLADVVGGETYGIEIAQDRYDDSCAVLDHTLCGSAFGMRLANGGYSCLWLNPPYDYDDDDRRLEHAFLTEVTRALCPGGLLVFIVPQRRLAVSARYLAGHYTRLNCYRFPMPDYESYQQVVVFGLKREAAVSDQASRQRIELWAVPGECPELPEVGSSDPAYDLPLLPAGPVIFASMFLDSEEAAREARERGLWVSPALAERLWPAEEQPMRPLMPLRRGHLAVLIAAGFLNNILLEAGGRRLLVKGRTYKVSVSVESGDPEVEIEREVLRTSIMALDLDSGAFETVQQAGTPDSHEEERRAA
jgi:SAM-dependent methyltransferase